MRTILMLGWEFPPYLSGGLGTACFGMVQALVQSGEKITFILPKSNTPMQTQVHTDTSIQSPKILSASDISITRYYSEKFKKIWKENIRFLQIPVDLHPYTFTNPDPKIEEDIYTNVTTHIKSYESIHTLPPCHGGYGPRLMEEVLRYTIAATQLAENETFDIIHAHDWMTYLAGITTKNISKKPFIVHVHATEFDRSGDTPNHEIFSIEKAGFEHADHIIAVSNYTKNIIIAKYNIAPSKISVVHNAVLPAAHQDSCYPKKNTKKQYVLFLGRITYQKAPEHFIYSAHLVAKKLPHVNFIMSGSGDMLTSMIEKVAQLKLGSRFHFTGFLQDQNVENIYSISDVYVMPSISEPFGITPLEAIRHGTPVIISKQSGVKEVLKNTLQVDFWDIQRLAHLMCALLSYPKLKKTIIEKARMELLHIRWEHAAKKLCHIYSTF